MACLGRYSQGEGGGGRGESNVSVGRVPPLSAEWLDKQSELDFSRLWLMEFCTCPVR